jgi:enoyl-CoA hydratase/carnithine racemase
VTSSRATNGEPHAVSDDVTMQRHDEHVGVVTIRRPPNNFFDTALVTALAAAYEELDGIGWCRAIVLASEGKHFCAGLDFAGNAGQDIAALYRAALGLFAAPLPVVAAVQGAAIGGGCGLALSADFRVATPRTRFSANFARLGFHHGFALSVTLPAAVGRQSAADLLLTGRRVGGEEAHALGLCDRLALDDDALLADALGYATELAASGPLAVRAIRATLRRGLVEEAELAMAHECAEQLRLGETADFAEGVRAVAERRPARFRGA